MNEVPRILLVEDDESYVRRLSRNLEMDHFEIEIALGGHQALQLLETAGFDLVITDVKMPDMDGLELLDIIRRGGRPGLDADMPVVVLTSVNSVETAVRAMKLGAADFITKESERDEITLRVRKAIEQKRLLTENRYLKDQLEQSNEFSEFVGESAAARHVRDEIARLAVQDVSVLITGETGVGKELAARALHRLRGPAAGPFTDVNCAALPDDSLIQSELFGHERGAFTGALQQRRGKFEIAGRGSLFLDEISELSRASQGKILKAVENRVIQRLGGSREIPVHCRFLFASNRDLLAEVRAGRFREDLYYRVNIYPIHIPPLRERCEDIPLLARFFLDFFCRKYRKEEKRLEGPATDRLLSYGWPGNVRELRNIMERLVIRAPAPGITIADLDTCGLASAPFDIRAVMLPPEGIRLDALEEDLTRQALERTGWSQKDAAALLGISVDRMNSRVKKFGITHPSWRRHKS